MPGTAPARRGQVAAAIPRAVVDGRPLPAYDRAALPAGVPGAVAAAGTVAPVGADLPAAIVRRRIGSAAVTIRLISSSPGGGPGAAGGGAAASGRSQA